MQTSKLVAAMGWATRILLGTVLGGLLGSSGESASAKELTWHSIPGGRWAQLEVPASGKTGFTQMPVQQTGVAFTNTIDEEAAAANRVLLNGSGLATGDFDNDGWPDLYFCSLDGKNTLYRNLGDWRFADVTAEAGLKRGPGHSRAAVFADLNGDGWLDLLVSRIGLGVECFLNDGRGKFQDATTAARTASRLGSMTLTLADVDGNATLDLYVTNNRSEDIRDRGQVKLQVADGAMKVPPQFQGRLLLVNGEVLEYGEPDQLYLNNGNGRFTPISWTGGRFRNEEGRPLPQPPLDWGLTASFRDVNDDGFPDLYVCNDFWTPDRLWLNDGKGRFQAAPRLMLRNTCASSMGVDFADINRDGRLDFFVVDMLSRNPRMRKRQKLAQAPMPSPIGAIDDRPQFMRNTLFVNRGDGTFAELANYAGLSASDWSWSPVFLDVDLDGYEDLLIASGHAKDVQDLDAAAQVRARQHPWSGFKNETERQRAFTQELKEHMRLYPSLNTPIVAFRNGGNLRFEDVTASWGTDQPGIHHAVALADFDRDGDLDLAVNNLDSAAGLLRNDGTAPRVAVRLRGQKPNTQGIGARITLLGGAVPSQSQEIISGGRYLAGSEPTLAFAAGRDAGKLTLEIRWRSGRRSRITGVQPNRLYEIQEEAASALPQPRAEPDNAGQPLFTDVSHLLRHAHHEEPFDDFARQPLLSRRLSQLGPGVGWFDVDGDGREDLIIASGRGGRLGCYRNDGQGGFQALRLAPPEAVEGRDQTTILGWRTADGRRRLLAGSSSYEDDESTSGAVLEFDLAAHTVKDRVPNLSASTGPLALGDLNGDGSLELLVGGRVVPGRYPEPASSRLYRLDGEQFQPDTANNTTLEDVGLVNGAVFSDLDGDALAELILACEWGPLRIFKNDRGQLVAWDPPVTRPGAPPSTLSQLTGWWTGVTTGDLDGDGRMDIVAANWGLNSDRVATEEHPVQLYYGDLLRRDRIDLIEAEWDPVGATFAPRARLYELAQELPVIAEHFSSHRAYSEASVSEILRLLSEKAQSLSAATLASTVLLNRGDRFEAMPLPTEAQWAPAFGVVVADFDGDGNEDIFLSQNFFATGGETPRLDAGRGLWLRGKGNGELEAISGRQSGIEVYGEQRGCAGADFDADGRTDLVVTQNGAATRLFRNVGAKPGLRVRLIGPPGNPDGIGAQVRWLAGSRQGAVREVHAGSGHWSQDSPTPVLGFGKRPAHLWVRWPGGATSTVALPPDAMEISVSHQNAVPGR